jgi:COP9 signalosome complex subunit 4
LIKNSASSHDDADLTLRSALFDYHVGFNELNEAAQTLSCVNLDSTSRHYSNKEKADIYIKCAEAYLGNDDSVEAETLLNKASPLMSAIAMTSSSSASSSADAPAAIANEEDVVDFGLQLRYRVTYARVLDANRKFVESALRYYELSKIENADIVQAELDQLYCRAVTCIILGKSGNQRSRVMALISKDEDRLNNLERLEGENNTTPYSQHARVLLKMHREQILRADETRVFSDSLMPHQKAITKDGFTTVDQAVMEHNMLAVAKVYDNICFEELAKILHLTTSTEALDPLRVQKIAAGMISEGRLRASIDQTEGRWEFKPQDTSAEPANGASSGSGGSGDRGDRGDDYPPPSYEDMCQAEKVRIICKELSEFEDTVMNE